MSVSRNRAKLRVRWKEYKRKKNLYCLGRKQVDLTKYRKISQFKQLKAPENYSFFENTEALLCYLNLIKATAYKSKKVLIDFRDIKQLSNDAIVLTLAFINQPSLKNCEIIGNFPNDPKLKVILRESGLFGDQKGKNNYILTRSKKKADGKIANALIKKACSAVFGKEGRCPGIYRALMESMANTCYHAEPSRKAHEIWWLTVYHNMENGTVSFAFIDLGVGIFRSRKVRLFRENAFAMFSDNRGILEEMIAGKRRSSTKLHYRGKGLPAIYKGMERNYYTNLKIISNDVKADLKSNTFALLNQEFKGTFLSWELNNQNRWIEYESKS